MCVCVHDVNLNKTPGIRRENCAVDGQSVRLADALYVCPLNPLLQLSSKSDGSGGYSQVTFVLIVLQPSEIPACSELP